MAAVKSEPADDDAESNIDGAEGREWQKQISSTLILARTNQNLINLFTVEIQASCLWPLSHLTVRYFSNSGQSETNVVSFFSGSPFGATNPYIH